MTKPLVSTVLSLGYGTNAGGTYPALVGQMRGVINPNTGKPVANAGMRSLWGTHAENGETPLQTAIRCANFEFWAGNVPLTADDFIAVGTIETEKSINTLFILKHLLTYADIDVREGDGVFFAPLDQLDGYIKHNFLTEASVGTLSLIGDIDGLFMNLAA
jgi:hypothetical protein